MSQETYRWLATNVLAGFASTRKPWWAKGDETNLFDGPVPMDAVEKLLTSWSPLTAGLYDVDLEKAVQTLYTADMKPVQAVLREDIETVATHKLVKADDTGERMAVVGIDYAMHTYRNWVAGTITETVGDDAQISSAGLLRNRNQAWVTIERPESAVGPDGILFSPYVTISESLDASMSSQINQNVKLPICDNTLAIARNQGLAFRAKHTKGSGAKLADQRSVMTAIMHGESDFRAELERQLAIEVPDSAFEKFLEAFVPIEEDDKPRKRNRSQRIRQEITTLYRDDPRVSAWKGTLFGGVQAVNTWQTHMSQLRNSTGYEMDDTNLRAMRNYADALRTPKPGVESADQTTARILASVL
jgi:phage/plasmid-like protein (TIGR03299 family)